MRTFKITGTVNGVKSEPVEIDAEDKHIAIMKFLDKQLCMNLAMHQFENAVRVLKNENNIILRIIECDEVLK